MDIDSDDEVHEFEPDPLKITVHWEKSSKSKDYRGVKILSGVKRRNILQMWASTLDLSADRCSALHEPQFCRRLTEALFRYCSALTPAGH